MVYVWLSNGLTNNLDCLESDFEQCFIDSNLNRLYKEVGLRNPRKTDLNNIILKFPKFSETCLKIHLEIILNTSWIHFKYILNTSWIHLEYICWKIHLKSPKISETCWKIHLWKLWKWFVSVKNFVSKNYRHFEQ